MTNDKLCLWPCRGSRLILLLIALLLAACSQLPEDATPVLSPPAIGTPATPAPPPEDSPAVTTPTADPTTVEATPTLAPTLTATTVATLPVTDVAIQTVAAGPLPPTTRDLLFIADGSLKLWRQPERRVDVLLASNGEAVGDEERTLQQALVGDVTGYSISEDGRQAVVARLTRRETIIETLEDTEAMISLDDQRYELQWIDLSTGQSRALATSVPNLNDFALAPDGRALAYSTTSNIARPGTTTQMVLLGTASGATPEEVTTCSGRCFNIAWHPENNLVVWADEEALWLYNLTAARPEMLLANTIDVAQEVLVYSPIEWAANGRYLLVWKGLFEGGSRAVFDVPTGQVIDVPDSFVYVDPFATELTWMPDDRLYLLRSQDPAANPVPPTAELWRVDLDAGQLVLEESRRLSEQRLQATAPRHLLDGRFAYALVSETDATASGLYILTALAERETPERVNAILPSSFTPEIQWSPDGSGAIISQHDFLYYAPAGGDFLYDVRPVLGQQAHSFHWLPERPPSQ